MAAHLASLDLPKRSQIALFAKNNAWWLLADLAIWMAGHVSVPLYPDARAARRSGRSSSTASRGSSSSASSMASSR